MKAPMITKAMLFSLLTCSLAHASINYSCPEPAEIEMIQSELINPEPTGVFELTGWLNKMLDKTIEHEENHVVQQRSVLDEDNNPIKITGIISTYVEATNKRMLLPTGEPPLITALKKASVDQGVGLKALRCTYHVEGGDSDEVSLSSQWFSALSYSCVVLENNTIRCE